jgi:hypothetical protein
MYAGHIEPRLSVASLIGICVLCDAGCRVVFTKASCDVMYKDKIILWGNKDPSTNLWAFPLNVTNETVMTTQNSKLVGPKKDNTQHCMVAKGIKSQKNPPSLTHWGAAHLALFTHSIRAWEKSIKFARQSLCNPKIFTFLKATQHAFLNRCPNVSEKIMLKYLNPSPATAKGHMKRPCHGIRSTSSKPKKTVLQPIPIIPFPLPLAFLPMPPVIHKPGMPNLIGGDEDNRFIANVFCFGTFADKHNGVLCNDLAGSFLFISKDGSMCVF